MRSLSHYCFVCVCSNHIEVLVEKFFVPFHAGQEDFPVDRIIKEGRLMSVLPFLLPSFPPSLPPYLKASMSMTVSLPP